jgi:beta-lactam-binding protein with PASTA domain
LPLSSTIIASPQAAHVRVPEVTTLGIEDAFRRLREAGLKVAIKEPFSFSWANHPAPFEQDPVAGKLVEAGTTVTLSRLTGPHGLLAPLREDEAIVPSLIGKRTDEAIRLLGRDCLLWGGRFEALPASTAPSLFAAYHVVSQRPPAGTPHLQLQKEGDRLLISPVGFNARVLGPG